MKVNFAIILDEKNTRKIVEIQNKFSKKYKFIFQLGEYYNIPYINICRCDTLSDFDYKKYIKETAYYYIENYKDSNVEFDKLEYRENGWYIYICKQQEAIQNISNFLIKKIEKDIRANYVSYLKKNDIFLNHMIFSKTNFGENQQIIDEINKELDDLKDIKIKKLVVYEEGLFNLYNKTLFEFVF